MKEIIYSFLYVIAVSVFAVIGGSFLNTQNTNVPMLSFLKTWLQDKTMQFELLIVIVIFTIIVWGIRKIARTTEQQFQ